MKNSSIWQDQGLYIEDRPWGSFQVLGDFKDCKIKRLDVLPRQRLSLQSHQHRSEYWVMVRGTARVTLDDQVLTLNPGESVHIPRLAKHRIENIGSGLVSLIEVQLGDSFAEDDIVRYADDYQRA